MNYRKYMRKMLGNFFENVKNVEKFKMLIRCRLCFAHEHCVTTSRNM